MTGGSRSRTGCLTCRLRKKKCDEQRPNCQACRRSQLACYGYDTPVPAWVRDKSTWAEVRNSVEARNLQNLAGSNYRVSRKVQAEGSSDQATTASVDAGQVSGDHGSESSTALSSWNSASTLCARLGIQTMSNIWQLRPDTIWWDSIISSLGATDGSSSQRETRLLTIFLQVVHEITHTFYKLRSNNDRSWLLNRVLKCRALYYAALSTSACFECSLTQPTTINEIGMCPQVRSFQSLSVSKLRPEVEAYSASRYADPQDLVIEGVRLVDVILNLLNLETFSMLGGCWEMHLRAARAIFNHIEASVPYQDESQRSSLVQSVLKQLPRDDERRRTLEFCIANFVWIDTVATATFGLATYPACCFDCIPLLSAGEIKPQEVMGCSILAILVEIVRFERWCTEHRKDVLVPDIQVELMAKHQILTEKLRSEITSLELSNSVLDSSGSDDVSRDINLISIIWACAAHAYLEIIVFEMTNSSSSILPMIVESCLQKLEELPKRLMIRVCWPYTISGSTSIEEDQQTRFREVLANTLRECQAPGLTWKGLIIMEECWRLRATREDTNAGWRKAMSSLNTKVLLV